MALFRFIESSNKSLWYNKSLMSQNDFVTRLGREIVRIDPEGRKTTFTIKTYAMAEYLYSLQQYGYIFKPVPTIHNNLEPCESCSA